MCTNPKSIFWANHFIHGKIAHNTLNGITSFWPFLFPVKFQAHHSLISSFSSQHFFSFAHSCLLFSFACLRSAKTSQNISFLHGVWASKNYFKTWTTNQLNTTHMELMHVKHSNVWYRSQLKMCEFFVNWRFGWIAMIKMKEMHVNTTLIEIWLKKKTCGWNLKGISRFVMKKFVHIRMKTNEVNEIKYKNKKNFKTGTQQ